MLMAEFLALICDVRGRLVWRKEQQEWLPSIGSGGAVPWSWTACEVMRLLGDYQGGGVTGSVLASELQRRWRENNHVFGRNMAGRTGSLELVHQEGAVPWEAVLEVRLGPRVTGAGSSSNGGNMETMDSNKVVLLHQLTDWRGGRIDWYVHNKLAIHLASGLFPRDVLLRLTGLRCMQVRHSNSSSHQGRGSVARLLPTELFTVVFPTLEELSFVRDASPGSMWGRVLDVGKRSSDGLILTLEVLQGEKRKLVLLEEQQPLALLVKANDTLLLLDPLVGRAPGVVELSPNTVVCQHSHDPLSNGQHSEDLIARVERVQLVDLLRMPSRNATVLLLVTGCAEKVAEEGVVIRVWDESLGDESVPLFCWGQHGVESAAALKVGQWVLMQGLLSRKNKEDRLVLHCESESWGSRVAGSLPLAGLLASPCLWQPTLTLETAFEKKGGGPVAGVTVVAVQRPKNNAPITVRLDDGFSALWAIASVLAGEQLLAASGSRLSDLVGSKWNLWLACAEGPPGPRIDACVPVHAAQYVGSRLLKRL